MEKEIQIIKVMNMKYKLSLNILNILRWMFYIKFRLFEIAFSEIIIKRGSIK